MQTNLLLGLPFNHHSFYLFVFGATLAQYNLHYFIKKTAEPGSDRLLWSQQHMNLHRSLIGVGVMMCSYSLFFFTIFHFIFLSIMALVAFLYSFPVLPFRKKKKLKDFGLIKIVTLALLWTLVTVWFPLDQVNFSGTLFPLIFARRFLFIFVLCLLFDIRDMNTDRAEQRHTIPVVIGEQRSFWLCYGILAIIVILSVYELSLGRPFTYFNAMLISALATAFMVHESRKVRSDYLYLAGVDGMMLLQAGLVAIGSV